MHSTHRHAKPRWILALTLLTGTACGTTDPGPPNNPPTATGTIPAQTVHVGQTVTVPVSQYFDDPDGDALTYAATTADANVATVAISGSNALVTGVSQGNTTVIVTASDPDGQTAEQRFTVTVSNRAPEPVGTIPDRELFVRDTIRIDVSGYFKDPDGDVLTYTAGTADAGVATVTVSGSSVVVTGVSQGVVAISVTAGDPGGLTARQSFTVTVPNRAPEAVGTIPDLELFVRDTIRIDVSAYFEDPDGDPLTYTAGTADPSVATVTVYGSGVVVTGMSQGAVTVNVMAGDPGGLTARQSFTVTVPNRAPRTVGTIADLELFVRDTVRIDVSAYFTDPDGDMLTYRVASSDAGVATADLSGSTLTVIGLALGTVSVTVTASDPRGLSAKQNFATVVESRPLPEVQFATGSGAAPENADFALTITVWPRPDSTLEVGYTIGSDDDPGTDDADEADHGGGSEGTLRFNAGASHATIDIAVLDDNDPEPTREVFVISLDEPGDGAGYALGDTAAAVLTIEEGVCDRTPQVRDELIRLTGANHCREPDDSRLSEIDTLDLQGPAPAARQDRRKSRTEYSRCHAPSRSFSRPAGVELRIRPRECGSWMPAPEVPPPTSRNQGGGAFHEPIVSLRAGDFLGLADLKELWLFQNRLTKLPPGVFAGLDNLRRLLLGFNALTELPDSIFSGLSRLRDLSIQANQLERLAPDVFAGLSRLEELWMYENQLDEFPEGMSELVNLKKLVAWSNRLETFPAGTLANLSRLQELWLGDNLLTRIDQEAFSDLSGLVRLQLSENRLSALPSGLLSNLGSLESLLLHNNRLERVADGTFDGLGGLEHLDLSGNRLTELQGGLFSDLGGLEVLWLNDNRISTLGPGSFSGLSGLRLLSLWENWIADLEQATFTGLPRLHTLDLSENRLVELKSGAFAGLGRLEKLLLGRSDLAYVQPGTFNGLSRLSELYLEETALDGLADSTFKGLSSLSELWLNGTPINEISSNAFAGMSSLAGLHMSKTALERLPPGVFSPLTELEELWFGEGRIDSLPPGSFAALGDLSTLYLYQNQLSGLPEDMFTGLSRLKELNLQANPEAPFTLSVELERTDTTDLDAPGPAKVVATLAEGAPFAMKIPLSVEGGTTSVDTVVIKRGENTSAEFTVTQDSESDSGTVVTAGPAPDVPDDLHGIEVVADDTLQLFQSGGDSSDGQPEPPEGVPGRSPNPGVRERSVVSPGWTEGLPGVDLQAIRPRWTGTDGISHTGCTAAAARCTPGVRARSASVRAWSRPAAERAPSGPSRSSRGWLRR